MVIVKAASLGLTVESASQPKTTLLALPAPLPYLRTRNNHEEMGFFDSRGTVADQLAQYVKTI
ncbi:hypothetical protein [Mesorhizobium sp.]|uniref:hypothetical protein n=1 Tax=Mesorhizobium sp. TaxID=1871066 RepID=UPI0025FFCD61|nr:hypothetical protein [Mesorhizobium sp.]